MIPSQLTENKNEIISKSPSSKTQSAFSKQDKSVLNSFFTQYSEALFSCTPKRKANINPYQILGNHFSNSRFSRERFFITKHNMFYQRSHISHSKRKTKQKSLPKKPKIGFTKQTKKIKNTKVPLGIPKISVPKENYSFLLSKPKKTMDSLFVNTTFMKKNNTFGKQ